MGSTCRDERHPAFTRERDVKMDYVTPTHVPIAMSTEVRAGASRASQVDLSLETHRFIDGSDTRAPEGTGEQGSADAKASGSSKGEASGGGSSFPRISIFSRGCKRWRNAEVFR
eukprot:1067643-Pyramimonas_sp.AAC.2